MEIKRKNINEETLEAGDVVEWSNDSSDKIIAVITHITDEDLVYAITISDNRNERDFEQIHFVQFSSTFRLKLIMKGLEVRDDFEYDKIRED